MFRVLTQYPLVREYKISCRSSVVERTLGKGKAASSILADSTTPLNMGVCLICVVVPQETYRTLKV